MRGVVAAGVIGVAVVLSGCSKSRHDDNRAMCQVFRQLGNTGPRPSNTAARAAYANLARLHPTDARLQVIRQTVLKHRGEVEGQLVLQPGQLDELIAACGSRDVTVMTQVTETTTTPIVARLMLRPTPHRARERFVLTLTLEPATADGLWGTYVVAQHRVGERWVDAYILQNSDPPTWYSARDRRSQTAAGVAIPNGTAHMMLEWPAPAKGVYRLATAAFVRLTSTSSMPLRVPVVSEAFTLD